MTYDDRFRAVEQAVRENTPTDSMLTDDEVDGIVYAVLRALGEEPGDQP